MLVGKLAGMTKFYKGEYQFFGIASERASRQDVSLHTVAGHSGSVGVVTCFSALALPASLRY